MGSQPSTFVAIANPQEKDESHIIYKNGQQSQQHAIAVLRQNSKHKEEEDDDGGDCQCWFLGNGHDKSISSSKRRLKSINTSRHVNGTNHHTTSAASAAASHEILGTPLPDTPMTTRNRHRQQEANVAAAMSSPVQSTYGFGITKKAGSESETRGGGGSGGGGSFRSVLAGLSMTTSQQQQHQQHNKLKTKTSRIDPNLPQIHDGPDAEVELHRMYEIFEVIGIGSTSSCHRCVVRETGETRAAKLIDKYTLDDRFQGMLDQLTVEIDALRQLRGHPNIIALYDVFFASNQIVIIMEYMQGGELFDYVVQKGTLTEEEAANIVRQVTSALVYMHAHNICHRDLKPENLLLKEKPQANNPICIKIIDFGLAKIMKEDPVARSFLGTRGYLAPEMLQRQDYTRAIDTWALGVIAFVLLCGCLPFDDDAQELETLELLHEKFTLRFPKWSKSLSPTAKDLLKHLLEINPRMRYTAEQVLSHSWVQGSTASSQALLASPGRIRKSPKISASLRPPEERSTASPSSISPSSLRYKGGGGGGGTSVLSLSSGHYIHPPQRIPPPPPAIASSSSAASNLNHYIAQSPQHQDTRRARGGGMTTPPQSLGQRDSS